MIVRPKGMPRPSVMEVLAQPYGEQGGYQEIDLSDRDNYAIIHEHRLEEVGHQPCGWHHPTWPDEAEGRLAAHLTTCELR